MSRKRRKMLKNDTPEPVETCAFRCVISFFKTASASSFSNFALEYATSRRSQAIWDAWCCSRRRSIMSCMCRSSSWSCLRFASSRSLLARSWRFRASGLLHCSLMSNRAILISYTRSQLGPLTAHAKSEVAVGATLDTPFPPDDPYALRDEASRWSSLSLSAASSFSIPDSAQTMRARRLASVALFLTDSFTAAASSASVISNSILSRNVASSSRLRALRRALW